MYILIVYDVNINSETGAKRLRRLAKFCQNYGQRVQNSVFECKIESYMLPQIQKTIENIIDMKKDNIRIYQLGKEVNKKIITIGIEKGFDIEGTLLF